MTVREIDKAIGLAAAEASVGDNATMAEVRKRMLAVAGGELKRKAPRSGSWRG